MSFEENLLNMFGTFFNIILILFFLMSINSYFKHKQKIKKFVNKLKETVLGTK